MNPNWYIVFSFALIIAGVATLVLSIKRFAAAKTKREYVGAYEKMMGAAITCLAAYGTILFFVFSVFIKT